MNDLTLNQDKGKKTLDPELTSRRRRFMLDHFRGFPRTLKAIDAATREPKMFSLITMKVKLLITVNESIY